MEKTKIEKKNHTKMSFKGSKGITLVALIITIIILMILAGITLNVTLGQNGIFQKSKEAVDKYKEATQKEQAMLDNLYGEMSGYFVAKGQTETIDGKRIEELTTAKEKSQNPVIPKGYSAVQTETASWITETGSDGKSYVKGWNNGLVIKDSKGNEWVWIPVENPTDMYKTGSYTINGVQGTKYSRLYNYTETGRTERTDTLPTGTSYREPGYLSSYDSNQTYYGTGASGAGFSSSTDMTKKLVEDYNLMIASIEKYGGFYIGRYELSGTVDNPTVVAKKMPLTNTNWFRLNLACRKINTEDSTTSAMVWGAQWDEVMKWLQGNGINVKDSTNWGNYYNSAFTYIGEDGQRKDKYRQEEVEDYYDENGEYRYNYIDENGNLVGYYIDDDNSFYTYYNLDGTVYAIQDDTGSETIYKIGNTNYETWEEFYLANKYEMKKIPTGSSEHNKANNIYDLAGNVYDWTQEAYSSYYRVLRGGCFYNIGNNYPASNRNNVSASSSYNIYGARSTLIIK